MTDADWKLIATAPKGPVIEARRVLGDGTIVWQGLCEWKIIRHSDTDLSVGWAIPTAERAAKIRVPTPTQWRPRDQAATQPEKSAA